MEHTDVMQNPEQMAELAPYITSVECSEEAGSDDGKMNYHIAFETKDTQTSAMQFTLGMDDNGEIYEFPLSHGQMEGNFTYQTDSTHSCYLYVRPSSQKDTRSEAVKAFPASEFQILRFGFEEDTRMTVGYQCQNAVPEQVIVTLQGKQASGAKVTRNVCLTPFVRSFGLKDCGMEQFSSLGVSVRAVYTDCDACVTFYAARTCTIRTATPVMEWLAISSMEPFALEAVFSDTVYENADLYAGFYRNGRLVYQTDAAALQNGNVYTFAVADGHICMDSFLDYDVRFLAGKDGVFTAPGSAYRLLWEIPDIRHFEFVRADVPEKPKVLLRIAGSGSYPHRYEQKGTGQTYSASGCENGMETLCLDCDNMTEISLRFTAGAVSGAYSNSVVLKKEQFYIFQADGNTPAICLSDTPYIAMDKEIRVRLDLADASEISGTESAFQILCETQTFWLVLAASVWDFSAENRAKLRADYHSFLIQMEEHAYTAPQIRLVRELIADHLPMTFAETVFYRLHFDTDYEDAKCTQELYAGLIVKVSHSMIQYTQDSRLSPYLNSCVASAEEMFCVTQRDSALCLDPFTGNLGEGAFVDLMPQPVRTGGRLETVGGAAVIDLQSSELERPYALLAYHSKFPAAGQMITPVMARNTALLASPSYKDLRTGVPYFFSTNATDCQEAEIRGAYLTGRVHMTPYVSVFVNGQSCTVPYFTTVSDLRARFGLHEDTFTFCRKGLKADGRLSELCSLPLCSGDRLCEGGGLL